MVVAMATLVGTPTGGALLKVTDERHFTHLIIFCGVLMAAGTITLAMAGMIGSSRFQRVFRRKPAEDRPGSFEDSESGPSTVIENKQ